MKNTIRTLLFIVFWSISSSVFSQENTWYFLENSENNLKAFVKTRASLDSNEHTVYYWEGTIYSYIKGEQSKPLFNLKACSVARAVPHKNGYYLLTREAGIYTDVETGKMTTKWYNPFISNRVEVLPVWNNPVNQNFVLKSSRGEWLIDYALLGEDKVCFFTDIFLQYPSPVKKAEFPEYIQDDTYQAGEMFQFFVNKKDIANTKLKNIGCDIS